MKRTLNNKFFIFILLMPLLVSVPLHAEEETPAELEGVEVTNRLGGQVPPDLTFADEEGKAVTLRSYFEKQKPVILALVYYECPNLCTFLLNGAAESMKKLKWNVGEEFNVVAVSINPREGPELAKKKRESYVGLYDRETGSKGWHFLTGTEENIQTLADSVGFEFRYDEKTKQYAHPATLFILTSEGKLARILSGIRFLPKDLRLALLEASEGKIGNIVDQFLLFCYHYDPASNRYTLFATNLMKVGGAFTVLILGGLVFRLNRRGRKKA